MKGKDSMDDTDSTVNPEWREVVARHRLALDETPPLAVLVDEVVDDLEGWTESEKRLAFGDR